MDVPDRINWCENCGQHYTQWCPGCAACACVDSCDDDCPEQTR